MTSPKGFSESVSRKLELAVQHQASFENLPSESDAPKVLVSTLREICHSLPLEEGAALQCDGDVVASIRDAERDSDSNLHYLVALKSSIPVTEWADLAAAMRLLPASPVSIPCS